MNVIHLNFGDKRSIIPVHNIGSIAKTGCHIDIISNTNYKIASWDCKDEKEAHEQMDSMREAF